MNDNKTLLTIIAVGVIAIAAPVVIVSGCFALAVFWDVVDTTGLMTQRQQEVTMLWVVLFGSGLAIAALVIGVKRLLF